MMRSPFLSVLTFGLLASLVPSTSLAQSCTNYWINPNTGQRECLDFMTEPEPQPAPVVPGQGFSGQTPQVLPDAPERPLPDWSNVIPQDDPRFVDPSLGNGTSTVAPDAIQGGTPSRIVPAPGGTNPAQPQPGRVTPSQQQPLQNPGVGSPYLGIPSTTPSTGTPFLGIPSTGTPSTGFPATRTPAAPGLGTPSTGFPSTGTPGLGTPGSGTPSGSGSASDAVVIVSTEGDRVGIITREGYVLSTQGEYTGQVLQDGRILAPSGDMLGAVGQDGLLYSNDGRVIGILGNNELFNSPTNERIQMSPMPGL